MFSLLSDKLEGVFKQLRGHGKLSEKNISDALREIRMALLEADVEFSVVKTFMAAVKEKAVGEAVLRSITPGQQIVKVFHDELTKLLGGDPAPLDLNPPGRILMVGLNGAGKTTTSGKLALHLKKQGRRPVLVACDLVRPAAIEQLAALGRQVDIPVFTPQPGQRDVLAVAKEALAWAENLQATVVIFDTAGRQEVDEPLLAELKGLRDYLAPREVLLVADAATGQQSVSVAQTFDQAVGLSGIILTKLDGDARGGAALSMRSVTQKPVKFIGVGEKLSQLEAFVPDRMANRILGMGDVVSLVEKAAEAFDQEEAMNMAQRMMSAQFDFNDFLGQIRMMRKLGPMQEILGMIPGIKKQMGNMNVDEKRVKHLEAIVLAMTPKERKRPEIINGSRRRRIATGSGTSVPMVNQTIKQVGEMRKLMKNKGKMKQMMKQLGGGGGGGFPGMPGGKGFPF
ncbi:MAG: signal recognition particle protein [Verrucomicrobiales bacterium]|nr:signal recognition particle protein [Verrucomicrobiales bacterium]